MKSRVIVSLLAVSISMVQSMEIPPADQGQIAKNTFSRAPRVLRRPSGPLERREVPPLRARAGSGSSRSQGGTPRSSEDGSSPRSPRAGSLSCLDTMKTMSVGDIAYLKELAVSLDCHHEDGLLALFEQADERSTKLAFLIAQREQEERMLQEVKARITELLKEKINKQKI